MHQMTWRAEAELLERVRSCARASGRSMNEYVTWLARVATDPETAGTEAERLRERLDRAGLLASPVRPPGLQVHRPDPAVVAQARRAVSGGVQAADLVVEQRG